MDIAIAGIHGNCWQGGTKEENTKGMLQVIRNSKIHIISHPGDGTAELDFEPLALAAKESHTLLAETDFPDELIMNYWPKKFLEFLGLQ